MGLIDNLKQNMKEWSEQKKKEREEAAERNRLKREGELMFHQKKALTGRENPYVQQGWYNAQNELLKEIKAEKKLMADLKKEKIRTQILKEKKKQHKTKNNDDDIEKYNVVKK